MPARVCLPALAAAGVALALAGCGGGGKESAQALPPPPPLTVPGEKTSPKIPSTTTQTSTTQTQASTQTTPSTSTTPTTSAQPTGGATVPQTGGATPDTQQNDQPPPANSPAQKFEQFCKDNPGAC